jgi:predicted RNase H-like HicB family nuclease
MKLTKNIKDMIQKYEIILDWDDHDKIYVVSVTELKGCMTHGKTKAEALKMADEAIEGHVMTLLDLGETVPTPKCLIKRNGKIPLRIDSRKHDVLAKKAEKEGVSVNKYIERLIDKDIY